MFFAVDSADSVTPALYEEVCKAAGEAPAAWFRYIGGRFPASRAEVELLHARRCAVGLVYNATSAAVVAGGVSSGHAAAFLAASAAARLGAPSGTVLWADCEQEWNLSPAFLRAWCHHTGRYEPGLYCSPTGGGVSAAVRAAPGRLTLWAASWWRSDPPAGWPLPNVAGRRARVWQYRGGAFGGIVDCDRVASLDGLWRPAKGGPTCCGA